MLLFDDWNDPYQMYSIPYDENPELFSGLCGLLAGKLEEADDIWYRKGILPDLMEQAGFPAPVPYGRNDNGQ